MDDHLKFLSLAAATLVLSVNSPRPIIATTLESVSSDSQAQATYKSEAETKPLSHESIKQTIESSKQSLTSTRNDTNLFTLKDVYTLGKHEQAVESARASLTPTQELENSQAKAASFLTSASPSQSQVSSKSDNREATQVAISSLTTAWANKDKNSEAKALAALGSVYSSRGQNQDAIIFAQHGYRVAKENNIPAAAASSLVTLAGVHLEDGEYKQAIEASEQSIDYLEKLQQGETEGAALVMLGLAHFGEGNSPKSLEFAEKGLAISQKVKSPLTEALALMVLSLNYRNARDFQKAIELINQSRVIAREQNNPDLEAFALEVRGETYRQAGQKEEALASYQEAISINESFNGLAGIARVYKDSNLSNTAIIYEKKAVNRNEEQIPRLIPGLPTWVQQSFPKAVQDMNGLQPTEVYRSLATSLLPEQRSSEGQEVVELLKGQELRDYTGDTTINTTEDGKPVKLPLTPTEEQILKEYGSLLNFGKQVDECQQTRCSQLESLLAQRSKLTEKYYQTLENLEAEISKKREFDEALFNPNQFAQKAQEIVESQPGTVLIYPIEVNDKLWLMWASKGGVLKSVEVQGVSKSQLAGTVLRFRQLIQNRLSNIDELKATGRQLYDWLIEPLETELKANDIRNLVFALDRSTRYVPMAALFDGEKYLIENYSISTVLSANLTNTRSPEEDQKARNKPSSTAQTSTSSSQQSPALASREKSAPLPGNQNGVILGLGVSDAVGGFKPLPNVPAELDAIVRRDSGESQGIYPGQEFLNKEFTLFTLRDNLPGRQILHIATHGKFVPGRSRESFLLLGTGEKLVIPDIETSINLQGVNLAVLSACQTALGGPGLDGKEIAGIGYYFFKGGARTVMASLWNVDDQSTRLLMEEFYENLSQGTLLSPAMKPQALRQAQLALLSGKTIVPAQKQAENLPSTLNKNSFRHPYYWAAFILMGSGL